MYLYAYVENSVLKRADNRGKMLFFNYIFTRFKPQEASNVESF